jgi:tight adherence protein B
MTRFPLRLGVLAGVLLALPVTSAYADGGRITQIQPKGQTVTFVFTAEALPAGVSLDPKSVRVTVDDAEVGSSAEALTAADVKRSAELVIDTSGSMKGEGITGAKSAALAFVDAVPADVTVGLVAFADTARVVTAPTTNKGALRSAISALQPAGETSLYDGVELGLRELGKDGNRTLLILSDGADTRSRTSLASVLTQARASGATVNTVAFKTPDATGQVLSQIATAGHGRSVAAAKAGDIGTAFRATARAIQGALLVTATLPPGKVGNVTLAVTATAGSADVSDEALTTVDSRVPDAPKTDDGPIDVTPGRFGSKGALYGALAALFAGLAIFLMVGFGSLTPDRQAGRVRRRLSLYTLSGRAAAKEPPESTALGDSGVARSAVELAGRMVGGRGDLEAMIARQLEQGGSALRPAEWLLIHAGVTIGSALLFLLLSGGRVIPTVVGFVLGFVLPYAYLRFRAARRTNAFLSQMPDTLQLLAGSLSAGYSFPQAVDAVVREGAQPITTEFSRAIVESRLGVPLEDALEGVAQRMASRDFAWVVMAIRIQREVGGNLAEVLTTVAHTMRDRERVRRQARVLSAEGRLSAWILGGLPPSFAVYLLLVRPNYISPLFHDSIGIAMLVVGGVLFTVGALWLRKVVQVEV